MNNAADEDYYNINNNKYDIKIQKIGGFKIRNGGLMSIDHGKVNEPLPKINTIHFLKNNYNNNSLLSSRKEKSISFKLFLKNGWKMLTNKFR